MTPLSLQDPWDCIIIFLRNESKTGSPVTSDFAHREKVRALPLVSSIQFSGSTIFYNSIPTISNYICASISCWLQSPLSLKILQCSKLLTNFTLGSEDDLPILINLEFHWQSSTTIYKELYFITSIQPSAPCLPFFVALFALHVLPRKFTEKSCI